MLLKMHLLLHTPNKVNTCVHNHKYLCAKFTLMFTLIKLNTKHVQIFCFELPTLSPKVLKHNPLSHSEKKNERKINLKSSTGIFH